MLASVILRVRKGQDTKDTKKFSLLGSGVSTKIWTTYAARIMVISIIPVVVSQIPQVLHLSSGGQHLAILIALIVSVILTIAYIFYELLVQFYCEPLIQTSRINYVEHKQAMSGLLIYLDSCAQGELLTSNGEPNKDVLESCLRPLILIKVDLFHLMK
ncbi:sodium/calcium exchanger NCL2 [Rosa chinensis]|uniref:sodium/calcium exchanger NCL2 n=1 Tax=Rosa chinensis TaxID=74649 RepID=UPI001AD9101E|nr:sodium/calcium exchanger NCL2 [Rosa chinensis]